MCPRANGSDTRSSTTLIPVGYLAKNIVTRPHWIHAQSVVDVYSVSGCVSKNFADYVPLWRHNEFWLFDSVGRIRCLARDEKINLSNTMFFYYEVFEKEFTKAGEWSDFSADEGRETQIEAPVDGQLTGYDVVTFFSGTNPECSPLSCNGLANEIAVNRHCLFDTQAQAEQALEAGSFDHAEPGPFRIIAVHRVGGCG